MYVNSVLAKDGSAVVHVCTLKLIDMKKPINKLKPNKISPYKYKKQ